MSREPIRFRSSLIIMRCLILIPWGISRRFQRLFPRNGQVAHALRTLAPVADNVLLHLAAPRLACVKPAASVHPEPGSNSSLYIISLISQAVLTPLIRTSVPHLRSRCTPETPNRRLLLLSVLVVLVLHSFNQLFLPSGHFLSERDRKDRAFFLSLQIFFELFLRKKWTGHTTHWTNEIWV